MDRSSLNEVDFATGGLASVSIIAAEIGSVKKSCQAGRLAAHLWIAKATLDGTDVSRLVRLQKYLSCLLDNLERVCMWPKPSGIRRPLLRSLVARGTFRSLHRAQSQVRDGVLAFLACPAFFQERYLKTLRRFTRKITSANPPRERPSVLADTFEVLAIAEALDAHEYPPHVNALLYTLLRAHSECSCGSGAPATHDARLRLRHDVVQADGCVAFELLLAASPGKWDYWQDVLLNVAIAKPIQQGAHDSADDCADGTSKREEVLPPTGLCELLRARPGARICCRVQGSELRQLHGAVPIAQHAGPGPSIPLRRVLDNHHLSSRMKLVLAYIISRSFWQYYDSPWMDTKWTCDTIHFLPERDGRPSGTEDANIKATRPYFAVDFSQKGDSFPDLYESFSVVYRYPRLLALCLLLVEIGRGQSVPCDDFPSLDAELNACYSQTKEMAQQGACWVEFDYPVYRSALLDCLDPQLHDSPIRRGDGLVEMGVAARKATLYAVVVRPLERLLKSLGYWDDIHNVGPIDPRDHEPVPVTPTPAPAPLFDGRRDDGRKATGWLWKVAEITSYIDRLSSESSQPRNRRAIRIAVLDTGYDPDANFFGNPSRKRQIKGWKDWVNDSRKAIDENGHGSHTVALAMRVAPLADVFVARVARDAEELAKSAENVAQAILWAVNVCEVDIVSMSFGFRNEMLAIKDAIYAAGDRVLFFAAASNSGGNGREMFPARHDSVISIRATNSAGAFLDSNPPVDPYGPAVFGTLGKDVPSAWLSSLHSEATQSGSSVATPVAAGTAALVLAFAEAGYSRPERRLSLEVKQKLKTRRGMRAALAKMSQDMGQRCLFISPSYFFSNQDAESEWAALADACIHV